MERREFQTPAGPIWLWSDFASHDPARPLVLVIRGAIPQKHDLEWLRPTGADIVFAHLPGCHCPTLINDTVGVMIHAYDRVIRSAFADRRIILVGVSTGALVACGQRSAAIVGRVLVEPFFSTGDLHALHLVLRTIVPSANPRAWQWCHEVLGMSVSGIEDRDYSRLFSPDLPMIALVGDVPLTANSCPDGSLPSLTSEADRQRLREGGVELVLTRGGHDGPRRNPQAIIDAIEAMVRRVGSAGGR